MSTPQGRQRWTCAVCGAILPEYRGRGRHPTVCPPAGDCRQSACGELLTRLWSAANLMNDRVTPDKD